MNQGRFSKPFTQQEPISAQAIERVTEILQSGRLHRYNTVADEMSETALLEADYAAYQGARYCVAVTSGGQALQIALRATGVRPGDRILANAYTLAPVPGAMFSVGAAPVFVEIDRNWHIDLDDLRAKAQSTGAKFLMLSHMRGHIADMDAISALCREFGMTMIEDCAHTMGASWNGVRSGNFGAVACFSTQTYKHINSGEGGLLTTNDPEVAAKAVILSGSYMLYPGHGARPGNDVFDRIKLDSPNCSSRLDNMRAALIRAQLPELDDKTTAWNSRYQVLETALDAVAGLRVPPRANAENHVGSSIQFQVEGLPVGRIPDLVRACANRGVELKWFGADVPAGFTSRYDSWKYLGPLPELPQTKDVLSRTCDMRVPLTFTLEDCAIIGAIIAEEFRALSA